MPFIKIISSRVHCKMLLFLLFCILITNPAQAEVTEANLRSAILGRVTYTPTEMTEMDINTDGAVDVADLVAFISADGTPIVWFINEELTVTEFQQSLSIPIEISSSFSGNIRMQLTGTAGINDYAPVSLQIPVVEGETQASIPLNVLPDTLLEGTETLLISLLDPGTDGLYRTAIPSVTRIMIRDGSDGTCQGTFSSQIGIKLPAQSMGFVLDQGTAYFNLPDNSLLPSSFSMSATGDGVSSLELSSTASGSFNAEILDNRLVSWQLSFSNSTIEDGYFSSDYNLTYDQGLTASSVPFVMTGKFRCTMLE